MPLPPVEYARTPMHTRTVRVEAYRRADDLWDLEASLLDVKPHDVALQSDVHKKGGDAMHDMRLRVTIDGEFSIVDAIAVFDAVPYTGHCELIAGDYRKLVGLNLLHGFREALRERLGGRAGCTHLTELAQALPTAAVQGFAGDARFQQEMARREIEQGERPFQIDRCHSLRSDGPAVERYYPAWFRPQPTDADDESAASTEERS